jgi:RNA-directed DNA polymerase
LGSNKRKLHQVKRLIDKYLSGIKLQIKSDWQIFLITTRAIDFLGLRFFRDKTILRKRNVLRIKRRLVKISRKPIITRKDACAVVSYWGWIKRSNSYHFYNKYVKPILSIGLAKRMVSYYAKQLRNNT